MEEKGGKIVVMYVTPKTRKLKEYKIMQKEVLKSLDDMTGREKKVLLAANFNGKGINWKEMKGNGNAGL